MVREIIVELGERSYPIVIKNGILAEAGLRMRDAGLKGKAAVVTNPLVGGLYAGKVIESLEGAGFSPFLVTVPDGEEYKTLKEVSSIYDSLIGRRMERSSPVVALGGGVIGDMTGFAAATYLRGVPYIQIPTTLLSQVDSSVGGKTGVNHPMGKNLIGAFYQPKGVYIDPAVLSTLAPRERVSGLAEVVKYGVIWDREFFESLEKNAGKLSESGVELVEAIERSCRIKAEVVGADEREGGARAILNFGHTFGHAIEALSGYGTFRHGEAVAIGMVMASGLSVSLGLCQAGPAARVRGLISALGLPTEPPAIDASTLIEAMMLDKKVSGSAMRFVLMTDIGNVVIKEVSEADIRRFLRA